MAKNKSLIIVCFFLALGMILMGVSFFLQIQENRFMEGATKTKGQIIGYKSQNNYGHSLGVYSFPIVQFTSSKGETIEFVSNIGYQGFNSISHTKETTVYYYPNNPHNARIMESKKGINPLLVIGSIFVSIALLSITLKVLYKAGIIQVKWPQ